MKRAVMFVALSSMTFGFSVAGGVPSGSTAIATGFSSPAVLTGLEAGAGGAATAFAWAPDGRVFVARKKGVVDVYDHGAQHVFVDLRSEVNSAQGRGMLGLAVDPHFATNGWVYVMFTKELDPRLAGRRFGRSRRGAGQCPSVVTSLPVDHGGCTTCPGWRSGDHTLGRRNGCRPGGW